MDLQIPILAGKQMERVKNVCILLFSKIMWYYNVIKTKIQNFIFESDFTHDAFFFGTKALYVLMFELAYYHLN